MGALVTFSRSVALRVLGCAVIVAVLLAPARVFASVGPLPLRTLPRTPIQS